MKLQRTKRRERQWRPGPDYRVICPCQKHARRAQSVWRRTLRFAARGVALIVGVPLALAAFDFPNLENVNLDALRSQAPKIDEKKREPRLESSALPIFTTERAKEEFLAPDTAQRTLTLEIAKEAFFRTHVPYGAIIYREAKKNGLEPELVAAIVHTESDFRPRLVSHKSAQGLMQIIPETARLLGVTNPYDPEQNIAAGTRYLRYLMKRFPDQRTALAAYNAGETKVAREGIPPYRETLGYIEKVSRRRSQYERRVRTTYLAAARMQRAD